MDRFRIDLSRLDTNPGGQECPIKVEKMEEILSIEMLVVLF
jgi:hypothetical protein